MTLDNQALQKLVDLYRKVAEANADIAAVYAQQLNNQTALDAAMACVYAAVQQPVPAVDAVPAQATVAVEQVPTQDPNKPPAQRVAVAGFDMSKMGFAAGSSSIAWDVLIGHPPFHMFMSEQNFPNPEGKDAMELAVDFIMEQSKTKAELQFYAEYAKWFNAKGFWPDETPLGKPLPAKE